MPADPSHAPAPRSLVLAAFATVYLVWGATYLAMRVAIETLPPFLMVAGRFWIAGGVLYALLRLRGEPAPGTLHWRNAAISGLLLLVGGNSMVVWAEQTVPSGLAALLVSLVPAWFAIIDWIRPGGARPNRRTAMGILIGLGGMVLLVAHRGVSARTEPVNLLGAAALVFAGISWASGSLFSKHHIRAELPWMTAALQMLAGGAGAILLALFTGEFGRTDWSAISVRSLGACLYLIVFGSWIGFGAYVWILKSCKPSHVATYAYVNPVIALFLGNLLLDESLGGRELAAAAVILAGVVIITMPDNMAKVNGRLRKLLYLR